MSNHRQMVDSGVEWIGEIPEEWEVTRTKCLGEIKKDLNTGMRCTNRLSLTMSGVLRRSMEDANGLQASEFSTYQIFKKDDLVFKLIDLQNISTSRVGIVHEQGIMSPAYIRFEAQSPNFPRFLYYQFFSAYLNQVYNSMGGGVRQTLGRQDLSNFHIAIPPLPEQQAIATFLDHHASLIDRERSLIAQKIDLLRQKRKALIFEVVTGKRTIVEAESLAGDADSLQDVVFAGSWAAVPAPKSDDPFVKNGRLVDSGVEWIGEIPEGWRISKMKSFGGFCTGKNPEWKDSGYIPVFGSSEKSFGFTNKALSFGPAVCIGRKGTIDRPYFIEGPFWAVDTCMYSEVRGANHLINYVKYWLHIVPWSELGTKTAIPSLTQTDVNNTAILVAPLLEQQAIAKFLDKATSLIDREISLLEKKSELLSEKRKALIFEAVTGKIDLRPNT